VTADHKLLLLAFSYCSGESKENFAFLLECAKNSGIDLNGCTVFADGVTALDDPLSKTFPGAHRTQCAYHLAQKLGRARPDFLAIFRCDTREGFEDRLQGFAEAWPHEYGRLADAIKQLSKFTTDQFTGGFVSNSPAESLNNAARETRLKEPVTMALSMLQLGLQQREAVLSGVPAGGPVLIPRLNSLWGNFMQQMANFEIMPRTAAGATRGSGFLVIHKLSRKRFAVELGPPDGGQKPSCACMYLEQHGVPCPHAMKAMLYENRDPLQACAAFATTEAVRAGLLAGQTFILPVERIEPDERVRIPVAPAKQAGRPAHQRHRGPWEHGPGRQICGICGLPGHSAKSRIFHTDEERRIGAEAKQAEERQKAEKRERAQKAKLEAVKKAKRIASAKMREVKKRAKGK
jgi:hypothetical protein